VQIFPATDGWIKEQDAKAARHHKTSENSPAVDKRKSSVWLPVYTDGAPILEHFYKFMVRKSKSTKVYGDQKSGAPAKMGSPSEHMVRLNKFLWYATGGKGVSVRQLYELLLDDSKRNGWYVSDDAPAD
jgi:hypothetical protein